MQTFNVEPISFVKLFVSFCFIIGPKILIFYLLVMHTEYFYYTNLHQIHLQLHTILDEIIFGGQVLETSSTEVMKAVEAISK